MVAMYRASAADTRSSCIGNRICWQQRYLCFCLYEVQAKMDYEQKTNQKREVSMYEVPLPSFGNSGDGTPQDPYAADTVAFGVLFCVSR